MGKPPSACPRCHASTHAIERATIPGVTGWHVTECASTRSASRRWRPRDRAAAPRHEYPYGIPNDQCSRVLKPLYHLTASTTTWRLGGEDAGADDADAYCRVEVTRRRSRSAGHACCRSRAGVRCRSVETPASQRSSRGFARWCPAAARLRPKRERLRAPAIRFDGPAPDGHALAFEPETCRA